MTLDREDVENARQTTRLASPKKRTARAVAGGAGGWEEWGDMGRLRRVGAACERRLPQGRGEWEETPGGRAFWLAGWHAACIPRLPVRPGSLRCLVPMMAYVGVE